MCRRNFEKVPTRNIYNIMDDTTPSTHLIFDADTALQRIGYLSLPTAEHYERAVVENFNHIIDTCLEGLGVGNNYCVTLCFTGDERPRFRSAFDTHEVYKEVRGAVKKGPMFVGEMLQALKEECAARSKRWFWCMEDARNAEADDTVCSLATSLLHDGVEEYCIIGVDKDLLQIEGWHFNFLNNTFEYVDEVEAAKFVYWQMLVGDQTDSIGGIKGIGKVKADKLLNNLTVVETTRVVQQMYEATYTYPSWEAIYSERLAKLTLLSDLAR